MNKLIIGILLFAIAFSLMFGCTQTTPTNNTNTSNTGANTTPTNNNTNNTVATGTNDVPMPPALPE